MWCDYERLALFIRVFYIKFHNVTPVFQIWKTGVIISGLTPRLPDLRDKPNGREDRHNHRGPLRCRGDGWAKLGPAQAHPSDAVRQDLQRRPPRMDGQACGHVSAPPQTV